MSRAMDSVIGQQSANRVVYKGNIQVCSLYTAFIGRQGSPFLEATKTLRVSRGIALLFLEPRYWMVWGSAPRPGHLYPRERPSTRRTGGWVGPRAGLDRCGKSRPHRDSILGPSISQPVAIPTELPALHSLYNARKNTATGFIVLCVCSSLVLVPVSSLMMATYVEPKHVAVFTCVMKLCIDCITYT